MKTETELGKALRIYEAIMDRAKRMFLSSEHKTLEQAYRYQNIEVKAWNKYLSPHY